MDWANIFIWAFALGIASLFFIFSAILTILIIEFFQD